MSRGQNDEQAMWRSFVQEIRASLDEILVLQRLFEIEALVRLTDGVKCKVTLKLCFLCRTRSVSSHSAAQLIPMRL